MAKVLTGASVICYVNGRVYGQVASFNFKSSIQRRPIHGIDSLQPQELAPGPTKIIGTMRVVRTLNDGGAEGRGLTTDFSTLSAEQYFSMALVERSTGAIVFRASNCSVLSQSWDFPGKSIVSGTIEFEALNWTNESRGNTE